MGTRTHTQQNPYPEAGYGSLPGQGLGSPEKPEGYPLQCLIMCDEPGLRRDMYSGTLGKLWSEAYGLISQGVDTAEHSTRPFRSSGPIYHMIYEEGRDLLTAWPGEQVRT